MPRNKADTVAEDLFSRRPEGQGQGQGQDRREGDPRTLGGHVHGQRAG